MKRECIPAYTVLVDSIEDDLNAEESENYTLEFLNSLTPSGMPTHNIFLKQGAMLSRNINTNKGMSNGVRVIVKRMFNLFLHVQLLTDLPFRLRRVQFPIRLAYAITINKSQGQTFDKVGIFLNKPCFAHGQLYVAFSRAPSHKDIFVQIVKTPEQGKQRARYYTKNVVLPQVLLS